MTGKGMLYSRKLNDNSRGNSLEFDKQTGLLMHCTDKKVFIYTEDDFNHPISVFGKGNILNARFTPFETGFAVVENKAKTHNITAQTPRVSQIRLFSIYNENNQKPRVKEIKYEMQKKENFNDICFKTDIYDRSTQVIFVNTITK